MNATYTILIFEFVIVYFYINCTSLDDCAAALKEQRFDNRCATEDKAEKKSQLLLLLTATLGGYVTANVGSGSDITFFIYGSLIAPYLNPRRVMTAVELTASSVVIMGIVSLYVTVLRPPCCRCWGLG